MLILATILDNPGEPSAQTRYRDPHELKALGYNGLVLYETTALSGVHHPDCVGRGEMNRWVAQQFEKISHTITQAKEAGLAVYLTYDALSLPTNAIGHKPSELVCRNGHSSLCPASDETLTKCSQAMQGLLSQLPTVDGIVLRLGDTDAPRLPYLIGNDIYSPHCPRCSHLDRVTRLERIIHAFYEQVVTQLNKKLIVRAWNIRPNGMHDSIQLCQKLHHRLPGDPTDDRLVLSFKFTQTDFWRYQPWNLPSLQFGSRPILYELQCQREFEGKGGIPNWQLPLWQHGNPEVAVAEAKTSTSVKTSTPLTEDNANGGLAEMANKINLAGLWAWVRGGGWGGPFVKNESWIDANVFAVPKLAENPKVDSAKVADQWIRKRLHIEDEQTITIIKEILAQSPKIILDGLYIGPYAKAKANPWHPNADVIQDDLLDAQAAWSMIQKLPEPMLDQVVLEKQQAAQKIAVLHSKLHLLVNDSSRHTLEPLVHSMIYAESFFCAFRDLLAGMVAYRRFLKSHHPNDREATRQRLLAAQSHWNHHTQRHSALSGAATAFREEHFWDITDQFLSDVST